MYRRDDSGEYRKSVEKDRSLERRFQAVKVPAPNEEEAIQVINGVRERYEKFHAVGYTDERCAIWFIFPIHTFPTGSFPTRRSI